jgi:hypothetical protein
MFIAALQKIYSHTTKIFIVILQKSYGPLQKYSVTTKMFIVTLPKIYSPVQKCL